jgi:hypothetical protein
LLRSSENYEICTHVKLIPRRSWKKFKNLKIVWYQATLPKTGLSHVGIVCLLGVNVFKKKLMYLEGISKYVQCVICRSTRACTLMWKNLNWLVVTLSTHLYTCFLLSILTSFSMLFTSTPSFSLKKIPFQPLYNL